MMSVAARVDGLAKAPRFNPSFQLGNRHQRQQGNVRTAALDGIEQGLVFQIADENMFFHVRAGWHSRYGRATRRFLPAAKRKTVVFNQFFKYFVFLLVITGNIYRLTENIGSLSASFLVLEKVLYDMTRCSQDMVFSQVDLNLKVG